MPESEPLKPEEHSKSKRKQEMIALQKLGESLLKLTDDQLAKIELPNDLLKAIHEAKSLTSHEAKRRQMQYIGKIMREIDPEPIKLALKRLQFVHEKNTEQFHAVEEWRDKLLKHGDEALNSFLTEHPECDRQQLRQLVRNAQHDNKMNKNTGAETTLFKYLRTTLEK